MVPAPQGPSTPNALYRNLTAHTGSHLLRCARRPLRPEPLLAHPALLVPAARQRRPIPGDLLPGSAPFARRATGVSLRQAAHGPGPGPA